MPVNQNHYWSLKKLNKISKKVQVQASYLVEISEDKFIKRHFEALFANLVEQNLIKIVEPYSRVQIKHIAKKIGLDIQIVQRKLFFDVLID